MVRIAKCEKCGAKMGFLKAKESSVKGICVDCAQKRNKKKEKRKKAKINKAWLKAR